MRPLVDRGALHLQEIAQLFGSEKPFHHVRSSGRPDPSPEFNAICQESLRDLKKLKALEDENRRLKQIVADQTLDLHALKAVLSKKF